MSYYLLSKLNLFFSGLKFKLNINGYYSICLVYQEKIFICMYMCVNKWVLTCFF